MSAPGDLERAQQRNADTAHRCAEVAESTGSRLEQLAATYRMVAEGTRSPETKTRMLMHAVRVERRAEHERADAARFRHIAGAAPRHC